MATWQRIDAALRPVIGARGVAALFKRSLHLVTPHHAWWATAQPGLQASLDMDTLRSALAAQDDAEAAAGQARLLATFTHLLASLVGASLTQRLLRSATPPSPTSKPGEPRAADPLP